MFWWKKDRIEITSQILKILGIMERMAQSNVTTCEVIEELDRRLKNIEKVLDIAKKNR